MGDALGPMQRHARPLVDTLPGWLDPLDALDAMRSRPHAVLLLSGLQGHPASRFSILATDPVAVLEFRGGEAVLSRPGEAPESFAAADPLAVLGSYVPVLPEFRHDDLPFVGGAIGCLGYGLRRSVERLPPSPRNPLGQPDAWFGLYDAAAVFDSAARRVILVASHILPARANAAEARARERLAGLRSALAHGARPSPSPERAGRARAPGPPGLREARLTTSRPDYIRRVARALDYIAAGDIYQVNLSHRIECPFEGEPLDLFRDLSRQNPAPFAAYVDTGRLRIVCASPERFVGLDAGLAISSPIKGTRPRGATRAADERLASELLESAKDRAENVMIADLVRNDLGRVCEPGSVRVRHLCALESFATVHHLVSTIEGRLGAGQDRIGLLRALFPGGSMTGAPKVRAMEVIDEIEQEERGIYSGSIGYLSLDGRMDFNIVIRTILCAAGRAHLRVGGAIVADSSPDREFEETLDKARALLRALGAEIRSAS